MSAPAGAIDECIDAGLLTLRGDTLAFRHDLVRRAVEEGISPVRQRELDSAVLEALEAFGGADPARLVHHARRGRDADAIRRLAPRAARAAAAAHGHRQALEHWEAALQAADGADPEALEGVAVQAYLCGHPERAVEAGRALLSVHEAAGDALRTGDALRLLSRLLWWAGRGSEAATVGDRAIAVLEAFPDSRELAQALSGRAQLAMNGERAEEAIALGSRAVRLARRLDDAEIVAHGLTNVGTVLVGGPDTERGRALLEEAFVLATGVGEDDHAARALVNLSTSTLTRRRDDRRVDADIERALRFAQERELDGYVQYMLGIRANLRVRRGEWRGGGGRRAGIARARRAVRRQPVPGADRARAPAGATRRRRGGRHAGGGVGAGGGDPRAAAAGAGGVGAGGARLARRRPRADGRHRPPGLRAGGAARRRLGARRARLLALARRRPGRAARRTTRRPTPARSPATGRPRRRTGSASTARTTAPKRSARPTTRTRGWRRCGSIDEFGAARAASHLRRRLRADGVRRIPRGPRAASRSGPAGLTPRETEVLDLIVRGDTNAQIAQALVITPKTVDHHVSSVLAKLGVSSRREAGAALERLQFLGAGPDGDRGTPSRSAPRRPSRGSSRRRRRPARRRTPPRGPAWPRWCGCRSSVRSTS